MAAIGLVLLIGAVIGGIAFLDLGFSVASGGDEDRHRPRHDFMDSRSGLGVYCNVHPPWCVTGLQLAQNS